VLVTTTPNFGIPSVFNLHHLHHLHHARVPQPLPRSPWEHASTTEVRSSDAASGRKAHADWTSQIGCLPFVEVRYASASNCGEKVWNYLKGRWPAEKVAANYTLQETRRKQRG
jgi:hypothetical protein